MIRMTKLTDYGIVLLSRLASQPNLETQTARDLATCAGLPYPMASKILKALARAGLLASQRGAKGGYSLAYQPEEISVGDVIEALEGPIGITECASSPGSCEHEPTCPVRARWQEISGAVRNFLEEIPLTDLLCPTALPTIHLQGNPAGSTACS